MRILLATAVAIAPLLVASQAMANVVINTARTTPIRTSTATGTSADNIEIASGGAINISTGVAATVDSSHNFLMSSGSQIMMAAAADSATGVLVGPGLTSNVTIGGLISIQDSISAYPDTDNDGDTDGPWATGTDRYGVRYAAGAPVTGDLLVNSGGSITVEGNNSYGISIESGLIGKFQNFGSIGVAGDNSVAVRTTGTITGAVNLLGNIAASGANASAVSIGGDVGGRVSLQGSIGSSGYRYTSRPDEAFIAKLEPDDLLQGGPTVLIAANVAGGVLVDRPPTESDAASSDDDNDGIPDASETTGAISSFGQAAAIQIGSTTNSITLGVAGTGDNAYGFINRGTLSGQGVYDGITATALAIGGNPGQTVTINGGVRNEVSMSALAFDANATAVRFGSGAQTPVLFNSGTLTAGVSSTVAATATSVLIEAGANVTALNNSGTILATAGGGVANTYAVRDLSGSLNSITNTGQLQANVSANTAGDPITGRGVAIDVSANTTGVTLIQDGTASTPTAADPDTDGDGVPNSKEPQIYGAIQFGSGADVMDVRNGIVRGDMSFGAGADSLLVSGGADVRGAISDTDGNLAISVTKGVLETTQTNTQTLSSLNVGADGRLVMTVDPHAGANGGFNVTGAANLATGSQLGVRFNSLLTAPSRFNLISAGSLNAGGVNLGSLQDNAPYLYVVEGGIDAANNTVYADARQRTTQEAGLISVEASMYDAFYSSLSRDADMRNAFLAQLSRDDFINLYEQLLPDHSGGPLVSLASGVDAVTRALTGRNAS
ncbi:MAG TPA: autotransporter outer membrane beta-barrel domain-containing protein, partial [Brevundimonas sp.]|nr:autotransporter outer membrane beta-barrel domain-containing protein [Brevundimonas sp.]